MNHKRISMEAFSQRDGVSRRTAYNAAGATHSVGLDNVDDIASVLGVTGWELLMPGLPEDVLSRGKLQEVIENYIKSTQEGKEHIEAAARISPKTG